MSNTNENSRLVKSTCTDCGDVELRSSDIVVRKAAHDTSAEYRFCCPECHMTTVRPAEERVVKILEAVGCRQEEWSLPQELDERYFTEGKRLTEDDLINLQIELYQAGLFLDSSELESDLERDRHDIPPFGDIKQS